jgi:hypothetical protein
MMLAGRKRKILWLALTAPVALLLLAVPAGSVYYAAAGGKACIRCHELEPAYHSWSASTHRAVQCKECHGSIFSTDLAFHLNNVRQLWLHLQKKVPERLLIRQRDISRGMSERCGKCHQQEFAAWAAGPHHATYERIFLNADHNSKRLVNDQCLLCHGMFFECSIRELVQPLNRQGPWRLATVSVRPHEAAMPCVACHQVHRPGTPLGLLPKANPANPPEPRPSFAAFYDRREQVHLRAELLPLPAMRDCARPVTMSPDVRQAICYQCHAPDHTFQTASGDDRTCIGVHEGLSCQACHAGHDLDARASCAQCHPRLSNCGLDVAQMDTTFKSTASRHNIHFVKCADCHIDGVPARSKPSAQLR